MNDDELKDLGELIVQLRVRLDTEFPRGDVQISSGFKQACSKWEDSVDCSIKFTKSGASVTTSLKDKSKNQKIYMPNQWFVLASYATDLTRELIRYRSYTDKILDECKDEFIRADSSLKSNKKSDKLDHGKTYQALEGGKNTEIAGVFKRGSEKILGTSNIDAETVKTNSALLYRFVSEGKWWHPGASKWKTIDRGDFYVSSVLGSLNLINASQSYVATLAYAFATDDEFYSSLSYTTASCISDDDVPRNRIFFGAPGTGKSYRLNEEKDDLLSNGGEYERVTFHPDYSYANFVGTYKPVPDKKNPDMITYSYVPGPFMRVYVNAVRSRLNGENRPYLLIVEEINRADPAAVFGDVFQLLDRNSAGESEYPVQASEDIRTYLAREFKNLPDPPTKELRLPSNMYIWATMNSADQGVFPMDTAFKRRWNFTYIGIDDEENELGGQEFILGTGNCQRKVTWNTLRTAINGYLVTEKINEDKQLGPFFLSEDIVAPDGGGEIDNGKFISAFKDKVIMYLFEDAAKPISQRLFEGCGDKNGRYSDICNEFDTKGIYIFCKDISDSINEQEKEKG